MAKVRMVSSVESVKILRTSAIKGWLCKLSCGHSRAVSSAGRTKRPRHLVCPACQKAWNDQSKPK